MQVDEAAASGAKVKKVYCCLDCAVILGVIRTKAEHQVKGKKSICPAEGKEDEESSKKRELASGRKDSSRLSTKDYVAWLKDARPTEYRALEWSDAARKALK